MKICSKCNRHMVHIMSFSRGKSEQFYRCTNPKCLSETKHSRISKYDFSKYKNRE